MWRIDCLLYEERVVFVAILFFISTLFLVTGFGFLAFEDDEACARCCAEHFINLNGKQVCTLIGFHPSEYVRPNEFADCTLVFGHFFVCFVFCRSKLKEPKRETKTIPMTLRPLRGTKIRCPLR